MSKRANEGEDKVIALDGKKQVTIRKFNNIKLVDIREFYIDKTTQEKRPGKKGISLTEDVWKKLIANKDEIQEALDNLDGGSKPKKKAKSEAIVKDSESEEE